MYTKILLVIIIVILSAFFYLHTNNPGVVTYVVSSKHVYVLPATMLLFAGFFAGVVVAVLNSLLADGRRAWRDMQSRKEKKLLVQADENYRKGTELLVKGETAGARELIEKAMKAKPSETGFIISLAETYMRENRPAEAVKVLESGFVGNSSSIGILSSLARCASDSGDVMRATKALEEVVRLDPRNLYALRKLRDIRVKEALWVDAADLQKKIVESEKDEAARKKEKKLLTGLLFESASRFCSDGKLSDALLKLKEVLRNDDAFMPAHLLLGDVLARQGNPANAIKVWEKARVKFPKAEAIILRLEDIYISESAPERILEKYKKEIHANHADYNLRLLLARLYLRLEMVDNAIEELEALANEGVEGYYHHVLLGEAYLRRKQSGKAAHLFQKALGMDREFSPAFACSCCAGSSQAWAPRCPSCGEWNTLAMKGVPAPARLLNAQRKLF
jgi:lipopolysaccharide biosynthesis regulator YciM